MAGIWGTLALGLFANPDAVLGGDGPAGFLYGGDAAQLVSQFVGVISIVAFVGVCSGTMFLVMRERKQLRVSPEEEMLGMDIAEHATPAYNDDAVGMDAFLEQAPTSLGFDDDWLEAGV